MTAASPLARVEGTEPAAPTTSRVRRRRASPCSDTPWSRSVCAISSTGTAARSFGLTPEDLTSPDLTFPSVVRPRVFRQQIETSGPRRRPGARRRPGPFLPRVALPPPSMRLRRQRTILRPHAKTRNPMMSSKRRPGSDRSAILADPDEPHTDMRVGTPSGLRFRVRSYTRGPPYGRVHGDRIRDGRRHSSGPRAPLDPSSGSPGSRGSTRGASRPPSRCRFRRSSDWRRRWARSTG
jgi:hypothetical protein